jgi:hypothetical protein
MDELYLPEPAPDWIEAIMATITDHEVAVGDPSNLTHQQLLFPSEVA